MHRDVKSCSRNFVAQESNSKKNRKFVSRTIISCDKINHLDESEVIINGSDFSPIETNGNPIETDCSPSEVESTDVNIVTKDESADKTCDSKHLIRRDDNTRLIRRDDNKHLHSVDETAVSRIIVRQCSVDSSKVVLRNNVNRVIVRPQSMFESNELSENVAAPICVKSVVNTQKRKLLRPISAIENGQAFFIGDMRSRSYDLVKSYSDSQKYEHHQHFQYNESTLYEEDNNNNLSVLEKVKLFDNNNVHIENNNNNNDPDLSECLQLECRQEVSAKKASSVSGAIQLVSGREKASKRPHPNQLKTLSNPDKSLNNGLDKSLKITLSNPEKSLSNVPDKSLKITLSNPEKNLTTVCVPDKSLTTTLSNPEKNLTTVSIPDKSLLEILSNPEKILTTVSVPDKSFKNPEKHQRRHKRSDVGDKVVRILRRKSKSYEFKEQRKQKGVSLPDNLAKV